MNCSGCRWQGTPAICKQCRPEKPDVPLTKTVDARRLPEKRMTKAEEQYGRILQAEFPHCSVLYEALRLKLRSGHAYTPDWIVMFKSGQILCVEVKVRGKKGFRQFSYGRAKLAFDEARVQWPCFTFRWAEKHQGEWREG